MAVVIKAVDNLDDQYAYSRQAHRCHFHLIAYDGVRRERDHQIYLFMSHLQQLFVKNYELHFRQLDYVHCD